MSESIGEWLSNRLQSFQPSREIGLRAFRHLSAKVKQNLFSNNEHTRSNAVGQWYEAIIYERALELTREDSGCAVIKKGSDVWWRNRTRSKLGQDGLFYDLAGAIVVRGNGQDLAELDLLLANRQNEIAFVEVKISGNNLEELDEEIEYKRRLLGHLLHASVEFVFVSCMDTSDNTVIKRIASKPKSYLAKTYGVNELLSNVQKEDMSRQMQIFNDGYRSILLSNLRQNKIGYSELHDRCRDELLSSVTDRRAVSFEENSWIIKRLIVGYLSEASKTSLLNHNRIIIKNKTLSSNDVSALPKVVFALRMPELRPELYLKVQKKPVYLKMGPSTNSTFEFERNIRRNRTAFFNWLEITSLEINPDLMDSLIVKCLSDEVLGSRKKRGESPDFS